MPVHGIRFEARPSFTELARIGDPHLQLACASLLKPLLFWVTEQDTPHEQWVAQAEWAVVMSANGPTVEIWQRYGGQVLLDRIAEKTGVAWKAHEGLSFGQVLVSAQEVARAYTALGIAAAGNAAAERVIQWMRRVPSEQSFCTRPVAEALMGASLACKSGWDVAAPNQLRSHAVAITPVGAHGMTGAVLLSSLAIAPKACEAYLRHYQEGSEVLDIHQHHAGPRLSAALHDLFAASGH